MKQLFFFLMCATCLVQTSYLMSMKNRENKVPEHLLQVKKLYKDLQFFYSEDEIFRRIGKKCYKEKFDHDKEPQLESIVEEMSGTVDFKRWPTEYTFFVPAYAFVIGLSIFFQQPLYRAPDFWILNILGMLYLSSVVRGKVFCSNLYKEYGKALLEAASEYKDIRDLKD